MQMTTYTMGVFAPTMDLDEIYMDGSPTYSSAYGLIFNLTMAYASGKNHWFGFPL